MNAHDYIIEVLSRLEKFGSMTWHYTVRLGWEPGEYHVGKAGVRRRILLRAIEKQWVNVCGGKLVITPHGKRELKDALRAV